MNDDERKSIVLFFKEFCRGEDEQKRRSFRGGRKKRVPKRERIHEKHIIKLKWLLHCFDRALLYIYGREKEVSQSRFLLGGGGEDISSFVCFFR